MEYGEGNGFTWSIEMIVGIVIGGTVILIIFIVLCCWLCARKRCWKNKSIANDDGYYNDTWKSTEAFTPDKNKRSSAEEMPPCYTTAMTYPKVETQWPTQRMADTEGNIMAPPMFGEEPSGKKIHDGEQGVTQSFHGRLMGRLAKMSMHRRKSEQLILSSNNNQSYPTKKKSDTGMKKARSRSVQSRLSELFGEVYMNNATRFDEATFAVMESLDNDSFLHKLEDAAYLQRSSQLETTDVSTQIDPSQITAPAVSQQPTCSDLHVLTNADLSRGVDGIQPFRFPRPGPPVSGMAHHLYSLSTATNESPRDDQTAMTTQSGEIVSHSPPPISGEHNRDSQTDIGARNDGSLAAYCSRSRSYDTLSRQAGQVGNPNKPHWPVPLFEPATDIAFHPNNHLNPDRRESNHQTTHLKLTPSEILQLMYDRQAKLSESPIHIDRLLGLDGIESILTERNTDLGTSNSSIETGHDSIDSRSIMLTEPSQSTGFRSAS